MGLFDYFSKKDKPASSFGSKRRESKKPEVEATRHCFVLCKGADPGDLSRAAAVVAKVFGPGYSADASEKNIISVTRGRDTIGFLMHMPIPIPAGEAEENADGNFLWPEGKETAARHQSHAIVTNIGGDDQTPVQSALVVSRLAMVALELFDGLGVYWGNASVCNSREIFEDFCEEISEEHLPVPVWLRFQLIRPQKGEGVGIYTLGMNQFGLMDIEVDGCQMDVQDLFEFVSNIAHYLILSGPVIADGNTVGGSAEEKILVRHRPSMIEPERKVYKIVFEN